MEFRDNDNDAWQDQYVSAVGRHSTAAAKEAKLDPTEDPELQIDAYLIAEELNFVRHLSQLSVADSTKNEHTLIFNPPSKNGTMRNIEVGYELHAELDGERAPYAVLFIDYTHSFWDVPTEQKKSIDAGLATLEAIAKRVVDGFNTTIPGLVSWVGDYSDTDDDGGDTNAIEEEETDRRVYIGMSLASLGLTDDRIFELREAVAGRRVALEADEEHPESRMIFEMLEKSIGRLSAMARENARERFAVMAHDDVYKEAVETSTREWLEKASGLWGALVAEVIYSVLALSYNLWPSGGTSPLMSLTSSLTMPNTTTKNRQSDNDDGQDDLARAMIEGPDRIFDLPDPDPDTKRGSIKMDDYYTTLEPFLTDASLLALYRSSPSVRYWMQRMNIWQVRAGRISGGNLRIDATRENPVWMMDAYRTTAAWDINMRNGSPGDILHKPLYFTSSSPTGDGTQGSINVAIFLHPIGSFPTSQRPPASRRSFGFQMHIGIRGFHSNWPEVLEVGKPHAYSTWQNTPQRPAEEFSLRPSVTKIGPPAFQRLFDAMLVWIHGREVSLRTSELLGKEVYPHNPGLYRYLNAARTNIISFAVPSAQLSEEGVFLVYYFEVQHDAYIPENLEPQKHALLIDEMQQRLRYPDSNPIVPSNEDDGTLEAEASLRDELYTAFAVRHRLAMTRIVYDLRASGFLQVPGMDIALVKPTARTDWEFLGPQMVTRPLLITQRKTLAKQKMLEGSSTSEEEEEEEEKTASAEAGPCRVALTDEDRTYFEAMEPILTSSQMMEWSRSDEKFKCWLEQSDAWDRRLERISDGGQLFVPNGKKPFLWVRSYDLSYMMDTDVFNGLDAPTVSDVNIRFEDPLSGSTLQLYTRDMSVQIPSKTTFGTRRTLFFRLIFPLRPNDVSSGKWPIDMVTMFNRATGSRIGEFWPTRTTGRRSATSNMASKGVGTRALQQLVSSFLSSEWREKFDTVEVPWANPGLPANLALPTSSIELDTQPFDPDSVDSVALYYAFAAKKESSFTGFRGTVQEVIYDIMDSGYTPTNVLDTGSGTLDPKQLVYENRPLLVSSRHPDISILPAKRLLSEGYIGMATQRLQNVRYGTFVLAVFTHDMYDVAVCRDAETGTWRFPVGESGFGEGRIAAIERIWREHTLQTLPSYENLTVFDWDEQRAHVVLMRLEKDASVRVGRIAPRVTAVNAVALFNVSRELLYNNYQPESNRIAPFMELLRVPLLTSDAFYNLQSDSDRAYRF